MDPRVRTAIIEQLHLFKDHPLNIKHQIIVHKLNFAVLVDGQVVGSFIGPDRVLYVWCAVLLQRLKDALTAEEFQLWQVDHGLDVTYTTPSDAHLLLDNSNDPEVLRLLRAINQARQRLWE